MKGNANHAVLQVANVWLERCPIHGDLIPAFQYPRSPEIARASNALQHLTDHELEQLVGQHLSWRRAKALVASGLHSAKVGISLRRLHGLEPLDRDARDGEVPDRPPGDDHPDLLLNSRGEAVEYVSEPYGLSRKTFRAIRDFADKYGFAVEFDVSRSTHFPGRTAAVIYTVRKRSGAKGGAQ
jgi:hypothetical protein